MPMLPRPMMPSWIGIELKEGRYHVVPNGIKPKGIELEDILKFTETEIAILNNPNFDQQIIDLSWFIQGDEGITRPHSDQFHIYILPENII